MVKIKLIALILLLLLLQQDTFAQCVMCKAVAETGAENGIGKGLNDGILYLMAFPYLLMGTVAYFIYKHKRNQAKTN